MVLLYNSASCHLSRQMQNVMKIRSHSIAFTTTQQALLVGIEHDPDLPQALSTARLLEPHPVLVLVGGADGVAPQHRKACLEAVKIVSEVVDQVGAILVDGGTQSGVMGMAGSMRAATKGSYPLVGVAVESLVTWPGGPNGSRRFHLEPNHTHFILVPGKEWGDESPWIVQIASAIAGNYPSLTVLVNGGDISHKDIHLSLEAGRPVLVIQGTGRLADELASRPTNPPGMYFASLRDGHAAIAQRLRALLDPAK